MPFWNFGSNTNVPTSSFVSGYEDACDSDDTAVSEADIVEAEEEASTTEQQQVHLTAPVVVDMTSDGFDSDEDQLREDGITIVSSAPSLVDDVVMWHPVFFNRDQERSQRSSEPGLFASTSGSVGIVEGTQSNLSAHSWIGGSSILSMNANSLPSSIVSEMSLLSSNQSAGARSASSTQTFHQDPLIASNNSAATEPSAHALPVVASADDAVMWYVNTDHEGSLISSYSQRSSERGSSVSSLGTVATTGTHSNLPVPRSAGSSSILSTNANSLPSSLVDEMSLLSSIHSASDRTASSTQTHNQDPWMATNATERAVDASPPPDASPLPNQSHSVARAAASPIAGETASARIDMNPNVRVGDPISVPTGSSTNKESWFEAMSEEDWRLFHEQLSGIMAAIEEDDGGLTKEEILSLLIQQEEEKFWKKQCATPATSSKWKLAADTAALVGTVAFAAAMGVFLARRPRVW